MEKGAFYRFADNDVLIRDNGDVDLISVMPFEVMALTKDYLVVRFMFGASAFRTYKLATASATKWGKSKPTANTQESLTAIMIQVGDKSVSNASFEPWTGGFI